MDIIKFTDLPDWDDQEFHSEEDEGEEWKPNPTREACRTLYAKWQEVFFVLKGIMAPFLENGAEKDSMLAETAGDLIGDAHIVAVKIKSSEAAGIYVCRMENAAIIRKTAQGISSGLLLFVEDYDIDESHLLVVRNEITAFRQLFIQWINTFEKDEFTDDWGLFL